MKMLVKISGNQVNEVIIITHNWRRRYLYHVLLQIACEISLLLSCRRDFLSKCLPDKGRLYHTDLMTLIRTSLKHIPDFLQAKCETLAVNTMKG